MSNLTRHSSQQSQSQSSSLAVNVPDHGSLQNQNSIGHPSEVNSLASIKLEQSSSTLTHPSLVPTTSTQQTNFLYSPQCSPHLNITQQSNFNNLSSQINLVNQQNSSAVQNLSQSLTQNLQLDRQDTISAVQASQLGLAEHLSNSTMAMNGLHQNLIGLGNVGNGRIGAVSGAQ